MAIKYTEQDLCAVDLKSEYPNKEVKCPRCGKPLQFNEKGASYRVWCPTENCIDIVSRGL